MFVGHLEGVEDGFHLAEGIAFLLTGGIEEGFGCDYSSVDLVEACETDERSAHGFAIKNLPQAACFYCVEIIVGLIIDGLIIVVLG